jgi:arylsulfotransferase ASST/IPT/TIG domain-containing protein
VNPINLQLTATSGGAIEAGGRMGAEVTLSVGLVENQALVVAAPTASGADEDYWIRCLPADFPQIDVTKPGDPPPGWYLTGNAGGAGSYAIILDHDGTPVWYQKTAGPGTFNVTPRARNEVAWALGPDQGFGTDAGAAFTVYDLATEETRRLTTPTPPIDFHELLPLENGNLLMLATPLRAGMDLRPLGLGSSDTIVDCLIEEVDAVGRLQWRWRASDHIGVAESLHWAVHTVDRQQAYDVYHCNSVDRDPSTGDLLLSLRAADAVYRINAKSGTVRWKLGGNSVVADREQHLRITKDPEVAFHGQHDARFEPGNDVSLYDNQTWFLGAARGVEYHIDARAGTAALVWQYRSPDGQHSNATGSFRRYAGGDDNIVSWGFKLNTLFTEVDTAGRVLLDVRFSGGDTAYRTIKAPLAQFDIELLRRTAGLPGARALPRPVVTSIGPSVGRSSGGTVVELHGSGFTGATAVRFGSVESRSFTVVGDDSITAVAPTGSRSADVTVTTAGGRSAPRTANMLSRSDATFSTGTGSWVTNVNATIALARAPARSRPFSLETNCRKPGPSSAFSTGYPIPPGALIDGGLWAKTALGHARVRAALIFNDSGGSGLAVARSRYVQLSTRWVRLTVRGKSPVGTASVALTVDNADCHGALYLDDASLKGSARFTFGHLRPEVTSVSPIGGVGRGGTSVTITGAGFASASAVRFGRVRARSFSVSDDNSITAVAPPGHGAVEVTVSTAAGTSSTRSRNLLSAADSRFEAGIGLWEATENATVLLSGNRARTGKHSLEVRPMGVGLASVSTEPYPAGISGEYDAELWVATPGATEHVRPVMIFFGPTGQVLSTEEAPQLRRTARSGWTKLALSALSPAGTTSVAVGVSTTDAAGPLYVDDARLTSFVRFAYE